MLDIQAEQFGAVSVIHLRGLLTRETLKDAEEAWNDLMDDDPDVIGIDFREVAQIDSISINHLFKFMERAAVKKMKPVIFGASGHMLKLFELVKLDRVVTLMSWREFESEYMKDY